MNAPANAAGGHKRGVRQRERGIGRERGEDNSCPCAVKFPSVNVCDFIALFTSERKLKMR